MYNDSAIIIVVIASIILIGIIHKIIHKPKSFFRFFKGVFQGILKLLKTIFLLTIPVAVFLFYEFIFSGLLMITSGLSLVSAFISTCATVLWLFIKWNDIWWDGQSFINVLRILTFLAITSAGVCLAFGFMYTLLGVVGASSILSVILSLFSVIGIFYLTIHYHESKKPGAPRRLDDPSSDPRY